ncbi:UDP-N-acetylmuramate--L-alanine ligase [Henriciella pelagia]|jgi:UDP-N-acetylmuramate--alanine ligase|uniref:UDP-N-acetylmuramate--L-alanine ligase n=1 Tax=Henriciella pelagia TaxID=1977912 RepID=A0ABQ1JG23_9PROT|nr:UDP-N-acetylmuramate--L-alanine ligase [Henriciella pelagia]GGB65954.1 UDP-N-acetylmuramate--L-alanine ligase [Henriciella pelagia]
MTLKPSPFELGPAHLVGIGGIGMSGIAEIMINLGYKVQGSDVKESANVERLREKGATVHIGHKPENVDGAGAVIISSAIKGDNVEVQAARAKGIPVVRRADMLAEIIRMKWTVAVAGTHGKTTTTTMVAALLDGAGVDPTVINGGIINAYGSNAKAGRGDWIVLEADESDGTFTKLRPTIAIVTNMDPEHMEHYGSMEALRKAFDTYVGNIPFYGFGVLCTDHPEVSAMVSRVSDRRIITYGFNRQADVRAVNLESDPNGVTFDVMVRGRLGREDLIIEGVRLPMAGDHNVSNALASITVALELNATPEQIKQSFANFGGVKRRFTPAGEWNGIRIIDDYGHHPVEIQAVLKAARAMQGANRVIAVAQPHRYSRLHDLFEDFSQCFREADIALIAPVYAAGEDPIEGASHAELVLSIRSHGHKDVRALGDLGELPEVIRDTAQPGDMIVCLGAGDITAHANSLASKLGS